MKIVNRRQSGQPLLPLRQGIENKEGYTIYPTFHLEGKNIYEGIGSLAEYIAAQKTVVIDGYAGVFWVELKNKLQYIFNKRHLKIHIQDTQDWFLSREKIDAIIDPYLGGKDSIWGTKCDKELHDFFDQGKITGCVPDPYADINIVMGAGAALAHWEAPVIYLDLPKNELQYRMRTRSITNLGCSEPQDNTQMYKRFYFIDWVLLNKHKKDILNRIEIIADSQRPDVITWMFTHHLKQALQTMSENLFRVRPWFEPGIWGGQWIKKNIKGINQDEVNYAWSFELITPENGLLLESGGLMLEVSFDLLMFSHSKEILGEKNATIFGDEFPIRFDFLDTVEGSNLSIQCHPSVSYIKEHFGENFTQDETYYILDAGEGAEVYLGFQEDIDPVQFCKELEQSNDENVPVEITKHVQCHPAKKHDLFLIPNRTVHSAGSGNLVLEISATPYIFTFKMYDWLRLDLNGDSRPINIVHAFNNLDFSRKGKKVKEELISTPYELDSGVNWKLVHLPTHPEHFYDIYRFEFSDKVQVQTNGSCHVLMLVEGFFIMVETEKGCRQRFNYAETFVISAAAKSYTLINEGKEIVKVVIAFLKS